MMTVCVCIFITGAAHGDPSLHTYVFRFEVFSMYQEKYPCVCIHNCVCLYLWEINETGRKDPLKSLKQLFDHRTKWKLSHTFSRSSSGDRFEVRFLYRVTKSWFAAVLSGLFLGKQNGHTHIHVMESFITTEKLHTKAFLHRVYCECEVNGKEPVIR